MHTKILPVALKPTPKQEYPQKARKMCGFCSSTPPTQKYPQGKKRATTPPPPKKKKKKRRHQTTMNKYNKHKHKTKKPTTTTRTPPRPQPGAAAAPAPAWDTPAAVSSAGAVAVPAGPTRDRGDERRRAPRRWIWGRLRIPFYAFYQ